MTESELPKTEVHEIPAQVAIQVILIRCSIITIEKCSTKPHKTEVSGKGQKEFKHRRKFGWKKKSPYHRPEFVENNFAEE